MSCACVPGYDCDGPDLERWKIRKARKPHRCVECNREIAPGERYEYASSCYDGSWSHYATCLDCVSVAGAFFCDGLLIGGMWLMLKDHIEYLNGAIHSDCLVSLTPAARERVCEMIEDAWPEEE